MLMGCQHAYRPDMNSLFHFPAVGDEKRGGTSLG
jgi:hypothetical protein